VTLPEILHGALRLLNEGAQRVVIVRGDDHDRLDGRSRAYQVRLRYDDGVRCESRAWLGEQWSSWREEGGQFSEGSFDVADVLAVDWRWECPCEGTPLTKDNYL